MELTHSSDTIFPRTSRRRPPRCANVLPRSGQNRLVYLTRLSQVVGSMGTDSLSSQSNTATRLGEESASLHSQPAANFHDGPQNTDALVIKL